MLVMLVMVIVTMMTSFNCGHDGDEIVDGDIGNYDGSRNPSHQERYYLP